MTGPWVLRAPVSVVGPGAAAVEVLADEPVLSGHYPGNPVLPGVCVVESVHRAALATLPDGAVPEWAAIESARFLSPSRPGDVLAIALDWSAGDGWTCAAEVASAGEVVATVRLRYQRCDPPAPAKPAEPGPPLDADEVPRLLPHRPPVLLVDDVDVWEPGARLVASRALRPDEPWCAPGAPYPAALLVESWCQAAGLLAVDPDAPGGVMLLGAVQGAVFAGPVFPGERVEHRVRMSRSFGDTAVLGGQSVVSGRVVLSVKKIVVALRQAAGTEAG